MTDPFEKETRLLKWFFGGLFVLATSAVGLIVLSTIAKGKPCVSPALALEYPHVFTCLSFKDSYACNVNGALVTYARDGVRVPPAVQTTHDPACDTKPPTKFCADKGTSFTPNIGPLKIK